MSNVFKMSLQKVQGDFFVCMTSLRHRPYVVFSVSLLIIFVLFFQSRIHGSPALPIESRYSPQPGTFDGTWNYKRDANNFLLTDAQCGVAFPGLYEEVERPIARRRRNHITFQEIDAIKPKNGYIRCLIYDHQVRNICAD